MHEEDMAPQSNAPNMVEIKMSVPAKLLKEALEIADYEGWKPAELHRILWEKGFAVHAEGSNKRMVNRSLRRKHQRNEPSEDEE